MTATVAHPRVRAWLEIQDPLERQLEPLGRAVMTALRLKPGDQVLDVGCGVGGTPAALARAVGPSGAVVGLELIPDAVEVARRDPNLPANVSFVCGDAQTYPFDAATFDVVFSRFGVMFFGDPVAAFRNLHAALRPGGRLGFVCWRRLDENELDALPLRAAAPHLPAELVGETGAASWFSFADPAEIQKVLDAAGFADVRIEPHDAEVACGGLDATVDVCTRVGALGAILRDHPQATPAAATALRAALMERDGPAGPWLKAATWIVAARRLRA